MTRNKLIIKYVRALKGKTKILDIGCADMPEIEITKPSLLHKLIVDAAPQGVEVVGFDQNYERVGQLVTQGYKCISGDILNPTLNDQYDLIIAGEIIEHIHDQSLFFRSVGKLLKPGGTALVSTPNPSGIISVLGYWLIAEERGGEGHVLWQSPKTARYIAANEGLTLEKVHHCNWDYPEPWMYLAYPFELFPRMRPTLLFNFTKKIKYY